MDDSVFWAEKLGAVRMKIFHKCSRGYVKSEKKRGRRKVFARE